MAGSKIGTDCCGDRYACDCTRKCDCGCKLAYCQSCFEQHRTQLSVTLSARLREFEKTARALLDRLDEVHKASQDVYVVAFIHGVRYDGPTWNEQADKLRELLEGKAL